MILVVFMIVVFMNVRVFHQKNSYLKMILKNIYKGIKTTFFYMKSFRLLNFN